VRTASEQGILYPDSARERFRLTRYAPAPDLAQFVERHWTVRWNLRGREPYVQQLLPHPCVNVVFEPGRARVYGVGVARSDRVLSGSGRAFATKFRPGAFHPFLPMPMWRLTGGSLAIGEAFGAAGEELAAAVLAAGEDRAQIALMEAFLRERAPERDEHLETIARSAALMLDEPGLTRVEDLTERLGVSTRTLQRLFRRYVGVSPKWMLQRYRLHEAAERLADGRASDWARLALELGYFDQAHFIKDFKALVGASPAEYAAACAAATARAA
jgi:AraC-like DNA-binding protein